MPFLTQTFEQALRWKCSAACQTKAVMEANVNQALRQLEEAKQFHITMHNSTKVD
jgi:hypothetical protein